MLFMEAKFSGTVCRAAASSNKQDNQKSGQVEKPCFQSPLPGMTGSQKFSQKKTWSQNEVPR